MKKNAISVDVARTLTAGTQLILLAHDGHMNAPEGSKAKVGPRGLWSDRYGTYLDVVWDSSVIFQSNGGYYPWHFALAVEPKAAKPLTPQAKQVLDMLQASGRITGVQAANVLKVRSLSRRIVDLKQAGHTINRTIKTDHTGQRYAEYTLAA